MNRPNMPLQVVTMLATIIGCLLLFGCGGEPYSYEPSHELKPGPGLFSGEDGEFNLIGSPKEQENTKEEDAPKEEQKQE